MLGCRESGVVLVPMVQTGETRVSSVLLLEADKQERGAISPRREGVPRVAIPVRTPHRFGRFLAFHRHGLDPLKHTEIAGVSMCAEGGGGGGGGGEAAIAMPFLPCG